MKAEGPVIDRILARTRADLEPRRRKRAPALLQTLVRAAPKPPPFEAAVRRAPPARVVARLERKNPSRGLFAAGLDAHAAAADWAAGGAAAVAVWVEPAFFAGSPDDATRARAGSKLPLLWCDFVVDDYQLAEARVAGASAVLLFEAVAGSALPARLRAARDLGLEALVEVADEASLERALDAGAAAVSLGARELKSWGMDPAVARLAPRAARAGVLVVAADVAAAPADVRPLLDAGVDALLVGEPVVDAADRRVAARAFVDAGR